MGLEGTKWDRPSLHSTDAETRGLGRLFAVMDQHVDSVHPEYMAEHGAFRWYELKCLLCGFDAQKEVRDIYPEENHV